MVSELLLGILQVVSDLLQALLPHLVGFVLVDLILLRLIELTLGVDVQVREPTVEIAGGCDLTVSEVGSSACVVDVMNVYHLALVLGSCLACQELTVVLCPVLTLELRLIPTIRSQELLLVLKIVLLHLLNG